MLYPKNVPNIERILRIALGIIVVGLALSGQSLLGTNPTMRVVLIASAVFIVITGFVGWCPACALVGRKIKVNNPRKNA